MKEKLTREEVAALENCNVVDCSDCKTCQATKAIYKRLAEQLLEEMDKPKDDVWKYASDGITTAYVSYGSGPVVSASADYTFTRELPKTRARQIAEKEGRGLSEKYGWHELAKEFVTNVIETALEKYAAELKGKE